MPHADTVNAIMEFAKGLEGIDIETVGDGLEMWRLHRQIESAIENDLANWGLTARQVEILETLFHHPNDPVTPAELSDEVGLTRSAMTSALDSLEQPGYIVRAPHPRDRRSITISLTPSGREFIAERLPKRYAQMARIVGHLSPRERQMMIHGYTVLLSAVAEDARENPE